MGGARHFQELIVWQLADALRRQLVRLTRRPAYNGRRRLREQTEDAADSVCRNISEGFGADTHAQFAWFLRISRRSLNELQDAILSAQQKGMLSAADVMPLRALMKRLFPALNRFIAHLERNPARRNRPPAPLPARRTFTRRLDDSAPPTKR
jgi:four helix bundle protein